MKKYYLLVGVCLSVVVFGFAYQSYVTMRDTETNEQTQQRLMLEGARALGLDIHASSSAHLMASGTMKMEDGVMMASASMKTQ